MNCVPVCVNTIIPMILYSIIVCGVLSTELWAAWKYDRDWQKTWKLTKKKRIACLGTIGILCAIYSSRIIGSEDIVLIFLFGVILGSLLTAAVTDYYYCQVYCFVWWIAGMAECIWILVKGQEKLLGTGILEVSLFCLLQELFFGRMYGRADCHAFCVSALLLWNFGGDMRDFLIHMMISFLLLAMVQVFRKNINRRGNLKQPVAFVPYIVFSLCLLLGTI